MGVNHLRRDARMAQSGARTVENSGKSPNSTQVPGLNRPAETSGTTKVPEEPSVNSFGNRSAHPGNSTAQPPHDGGPAGAKGGQEHIGDPSGNKKQMSGGSYGGPVGV